MKRFLILILFAVPALVFSQKSYEDVVYVKNGSVLRGSIISQTAEKVTLEIAGGSRFVYQLTELDSIKRESVAKRKLKEIKTNYYRRDRGFRNMTEAGVLYGMNLKKNNPEPYYYYYNEDADDLGLSLHTVNGYQLWSYLYVGVGMGIDRYVTYKQTFSPFYVRVASEFLKRKVTPYVYFDAGYALMWKKKSNEYISYDNEGGLYLAAGGGLRIYTRARASVTLSAGFKRTVSESKWWYTNYNETYYTIARTYNRLAMNLGVTF